MRIVIAIIIIAVAPCADFVATLQAATPPPQSTYQLSGAPTPDEARRVVMALGVGQHVAVETRLGETLPGTIRVIADDHFVLLLDRSAAPASISYGEVRWVGPVPQLVPRPSRAPRAPSIGKTLAIVGVLTYFGFMAYCGQPGRC